MDLTKDYKLAEKEFIESQDLKAGDTLVVTRAAKSHEMGWPYSWVQGMDEIVGKRVSVVRTKRFEDSCLVLGPVVVRHITTSGLGSKQEEGNPDFEVTENYTDWRVPFFVLSDRKKPERVKTMFKLVQDRAGNRIHLVSTLHFENGCRSRIMAEIRPDGCLVEMHGGDPDRKRNLNSGFVIPLGLPSSYYRNRPWVGEDCVGKDASPDFCGPETIELNVSPPVEFETDDQFSHDNEIRVETPGTRGFNQMLNRI